MFWKIFPFSLFPMPFQDIFNAVVVDGFSEKASPAQALSCWYSLFRVSW